MLYLRIWDQSGRSPVWYEGSRAPPLNFHLHSVRTWIQQLLLEAPIQELGLSLCDVFSSSSSYCSCWAALCWLSFQCPLHHWDVQHLSGQEQRPLLEGWILPLRYWVTLFSFSSFSSSYVTHGHHQHLKKSQNGSLVRRIMNFLTALELLQRVFKSDRHQAQFSGERGLKWLICHEQI